MKQNKMEAVRQLLAANPAATPDEIVAALALKKIKITNGVASNYKSVIRAGAKKKRKSAKARKHSAAEIPSLPTQSANGEAHHGLDPAVVDLLKAGRAMGWKKVRAIVEIMIDA
jgi:hypothetical protein